jgi:hypothetical protein
VRIQVVIGCCLALMMGPYCIIYRTIKRIPIILLESREKFTKIVRVSRDLLLKSLHLLLRLILENEVSIYPSTIIAVQASLVLIPIL